MDINSNFILPDISTRKALFYLYEYRYATQMNKQNKSLIETKNKLMMIAKGGEFGMGGERGEKGEGEYGPKQCNNCRAVDGF